MSCCTSYTLAEGVEQYCIHTFNDKRKNFEHSLVFAKATWEELLKKTIWAVSGLWLPVLTSSRYKYPYLQLPCKIDRVLGLYDEDACGKLIPVVRSSYYSLLPKPAQKKCGCKKQCDCGDVCSNINSLSFTTKLHTIGGTPYYEKEWIEVCANGDVKRWRDVPAKKADGSVAVIQHSEVVCKLETHECGCAKETALNRQLLTDHCGCHVVCHSKLHSPQPAGSETSVQFDGDKAFLIGQRLKEFYFLHFQETEASAISAVPGYALFALMRGIDFRAKAFNPRVSRGEKRDARIDYDAAKDILFEELNPLTIEFINGLQEVRIKL